MDMIVDLYANHPFWIWMAFGAVLLAIEAATGSGWLLWAAASAAVTGLVSLTGLTSLPLEVFIFGALTLVTTLVSRRFIREVQGEGEDINDQASRLIGKTGRSVGAFNEGHGRAFIDGAEWSVDLEDGVDLASGVKVVVTGVAGPRLKVRPA
ncbi:MAG: NfeD family protein [Caulobacteraceae bacterium]|nr:NfeD family protein [Caulobacteraceae bacterium]